MANGLKAIVAQLERQRAGIERALSALREVEGVSAPVTVAAAAPAKPAKAKRKGGMTPEGKARLIAALKRRWAAKKAAEAEASATPKAGKKRGRPKKAR